MSRTQEVVADMEQKIRTFGWGVVGVAPVVGDKNPKLPFAYTCGLTPQYKHPEFIISVKALQLVWPDKDGRFPWDEGFELVDHQEILGER